MASVEQLENWLSNKEAFLANQDLGVSLAWLLQDKCQQHLDLDHDLLLSAQDSVPEVETLLRKQEQFEEVLEAQAEQLDEVEGLAQQLIQQKHFDSENIRARSKALAVRYPQGSAIAEPSSQWNADV